MVTARVHATTKSTVGSGICTPARLHPLGSGPAPRARRMSPEGRLARSARHYARPEQPGGPETRLRGLRHQPHQKLGHLLEISMIEDAAQRDGG